MITLEQRSMILAEATVLDLDEGGTRVKLELPDEHLWARVAIASTYCLCRGDVVVCARQNEQAYVIGVLLATGPMTISAPGDLAIEARGNVTVRAGAGLKVQAAEAQINTERLEIFAGRLLERFETVTRWVKGLFSQRAERMHTTCEGEHRLRCERNVQRSSAETRIDGKTIHLG